MNFKLVLNRRQQFRYRLSQHAVHEMGGAVASRYRRNKRSLHASNLRTVHLRDKSQYALVLELSVLLRRACCCAWETMFNVATGAFLTTSS